jgi:hypothetical protein
MIKNILSAGILGLASCVAFAGAAIVDDSTHYAETGFTAADTNGQNRRDNRGDNRDDRQDCRQDSGRVGNDKRDCKQNNRQGNGDDKGEGDS